MARMHEPGLRVRCMGTHGSGTRLLTRMINAAGMRGYHKSQPSSAYGEDPPNIHWPHMENSPIVWITRDLHSTVCANLYNGHATSVEGAYYNVNEAKRMLEFQTLPGEKVIHVRYEDIVADKDAVIAYIASELEVDPWEFDEEIVDGNEKYVGVNPADVKLHGRPQRVYVAGRKDSDYE